MTYVDGVQNSPRSAFVPRGGGGFGRDAAARKQLADEDAAVRHWLKAVGEAAAPFEGRWTWASLRRINPDIHRRLFEQRGMFDAATFKGTVADIETQGAALCRGYRAAIQTMEAADEPDDAYLIGQDPKSGLKVAISQMKAAIERARQVHGEKTIWVTPDEVAMIVASGELVKISVIKQAWPGAEVIGIRFRRPPRRKSSLRDVHYRANCVAKQLTFHFATPDKTYRPFCDKLGDMHHAVRLRSGQHHRAGHLNPGGRARRRWLHGGAEREGHRNEH
jgi:hypothetical protein